ncbi:MAG: hypothetical protein DI632_12100 [Sphingomonas hengshuiensis]|uniref:Cytochrome c oxidase subunit IV bacterial aa3 type domain-containing protein n=1 Tax=Sphingomonas hengshuiensis TaxID=1609977 RepID=A0A2W4Z411_9SPHN|nr:MAG: hypothetical protein DI632_12100 [Sphingomonas hengshuiensis]
MAGRMTRATLHANETNSRGASMAIDGRPPAHAGTYTSFLRWFTWGAVVCAALAALVIYLIAS